METQLFNLLKSLNSAEQEAFLAYVKNKFKRKKIAKPSQTSKNLLALAEIFDANSFLNTIFKNAGDFCFAEQKISVRKHKTETGPVVLVEIKNDHEFDEFLKKIIKTPTAKTNQGACLIFNKNLDLIIVSNKPYSGVSERFFNLNKQTWLELSTKIRIEHESTHYCTRQIYGQANNNLHDELVADFVALLHCVGKFKADWFMKFMSLGGANCRFNIYVDSLPDKVKKCCFIVASICAKFLEKWSTSFECCHKTKIEQIEFLCDIGIEKMANLPSCF